MQINREMVTAWLIHYLSVKLDIPDKEIQASSLLMDDLGMDELDILELPGDIGDKFNMLMPQCNECRTVGDVVDLVLLVAGGKKQSDIVDAAVIALENISGGNVGVPDNNDEASGSTGTVAVPDDADKTAVYAHCAFCSDGRVPVERASFPVCDTCRKIISDLIAQRKRIVI